MSDVTTCIKMMFDGYGAEDVLVRTGIPKRTYWAAVRAMRQKLGLTEFRRRFRGWDE